MKFTDLRKMEAELEKELAIVQAFKKLYERRAQRKATAELPATRPVKLRAALKAKLPKPPKTAPLNGRGAKAITIGALMADQPTPLSSADIIDKLKTAGIKISEQAVGAAARHGYLKAVGPRTNRTYTAGPKAQASA